ncbi:MAG: hypothetical protein J7454_00165 [Roseiflexus sp.]|nr:hypothetical protein [Roseiflexus sp.]
MWQFLKKSAYILPLSGYLALSLIIMAPVLPVFTTALPGGPIADVDGWQNVWNLWWVHRAVTTATNPFFTPLLFYPQGVDLTLQTLNISNGILFLPITALAGPIAAYNAAVITALTLSGIGGYALALRVSGDRLAAFVGGAVFTFSPFHLTKVWDGQLELITLQWVALYAFFLLRAVEEAQRRDALIAGVFLALIGYTSWYYLFFFSVYSLLFAAIWLAQAQPRQRWGMMRQFVTVAACGLLFLAPLLIAAPRAAQAMLVISSPWFDPAHPLDKILTRSANVYDLALPNGLHPLWGSAIEKLVRTWHPYIGAWNIAPGYVALALSIVALITARREAWRWAVIGLIAVVLSLGPIVQIGTMRTSIPLPYQVILAIPGLELARRPSHFIVITTLMLAPLVALGLRELRRRLPPQRGYAIIGVCAALIAVEFAPPRWLLHPFRVHPYYERLAGQPGAVMELPPPFEASKPLMAQIVHGQPLIGGFVSRIPLYPFVEQAPGVRQLWRMRPDDTHLFVDQADNRLKELNAFGIRHIIVHWDRISADRRTDLQAALQQTLGDLAPAYADGSLSAYRVPQIAQTPVAYAAFGNGWYAEERDGNRHWRWMAAEGEINLVNAGRSDTLIRMMISVQSYREERRLSVMLGDHVLGYRTVDPQGATIVMSFLLPPGEHRVRMLADATLDPASSRLISIVVTDARFFAIP